MGNVPPYIAHNRSAGLSADASFVSASILSALVTISQVSLLSALFTIRPDSSAPSLYAPDAILTPFSTSSAGVIVHTVTASSVSIYRLPALSE